tara:strand:+ start:39 stop:362 length:324 start_codon:yes stop_codon:yes gene_type:complete
MKRVSQTARIAGELQDISWWRDYGCAVLREKFVEMCVVDPESVSANVFVSLGLHLPTASFLLDGSPFPSVKTFKEAFSQQDMSFSDAVVTHVLKELVPLRANHSVIF